MCSIMAAKSSEKLKELVDLNQYRGNFSYSCTDLATKTINKDFGEFPNDVIQRVDSWVIAHVQAPTGGLLKERDRIHPTESERGLLWHNGIITTRGVKYMQQRLQTEDTFDTRLLHQMLDRYGFDCLSEIEGGFACLYMKDGEMFMFRTRHLKLHIADDSISSERQTHGRMINPDTIYRLKFTDRIEYEEIGSFRTKRYNFNIPGEL